eukprot:3158206-Pyramimonas_sp.AAC.1
MHSSRLDTDIPLTKWGSGHRRADVAQALSDSMVPESASPAFSAPDPRRLRAQGRLGAGGVRHGLDSRLHAHIHHPPL